MWRRRPARVGPPTQFSWKNVRNRPGLPSGNYTADVFNQHMPTWCGCCYLVSAVQMIEDRLAVARRTPTRRIHLSLQDVLDHFNAASERNACHGGLTSHVLECFATGTCPLHPSPTPSHDWVGHPRSAVSPKSIPSFRVQRVRRVPPTEVAHELYKRGPLVLEVNAYTLKRLSANGCAADLTPRPPNHTVGVIGYRCVDGQDCWILRNSWGTHRVPKALPEDLSCVATDQNDCIVEWEYWSGATDAPGFVYLPISYPPLHATDPSPWVTADVLSE